MLTFPDIDPVLFEIGPLAIRWYSLSYVAGIILGCLYADWLNQKIPPVQKNLRIFDDFLTWVVLGIILGGRIGYVLFYNLEFYLENPAAIIEVWNGGMSFHGGFLGVAVAIWMFCKKYKIPIGTMIDLAACSAPIGLFFGRVANFINGELYGRVTDAPIGMIFPNAGPYPRHPSQLYEAALEGLVLFLILFVMARYTRARTRSGLLCGVFLCGYALSRIIVEYFREPDTQIGFLWQGITMGQTLSLPMVLVGLYLIVHALRKQPNVS